MWAAFQPKHWLVVRVWQSLHDGDQSSGFEPVQSKSTANYSKSIEFSSMSVRNPAHFCGVFVHKPTWGIMPLRSQTYPGALSVAQELDRAVPGPIARTAYDLALAFSLLAGPDVLTRSGVI